MNPKIKTIQVSIFVVLLVLTSMQIPSSQAQTDYGDIHLSGSDSMTISGNALCNNLTISEDATLILEDGYLQVRGIIRMSDSARLFIIRSTFRVMPPPLNDSTMIIHVTDNCLINAREGSSVVFDPQPTATNISYMLLEDQSSFFLLDSSFSGDLPSIINQSIEIASVTAGVYLLSGYASWYIIDSDVEGTLSYEGGELTGRWFWCSLHQRSKFSIESSNIQLTSSSSSSTMLKPVSGDVIIKNTNILGGTIDGEVTAEFTLEDSVFHKKVEFKDQTKAWIVNCTFRKNIIIGSTLSEVEALSSPETHVEISNSTFEGYVTCKANSTTIMTGTSVKTMIINDNATVNVKDLLIQNLLSVKDHSNVNFINGSVNLISLDDSAFLSLEGDFDLPNIAIYGSGIQKEGVSASISGVKIETIAIYTDFLSSVSFENVQLGNITFENEISATFQCINSEIKRVRPLRSGENTTLNFINANSDLPDFLEINDNVTVNIFYRLTVLVYLNLLPQDAKVKISNGPDNEWEDMTESGERSFDLPSWSIVRGETQYFQDYDVLASHLGFSQTKEVVLTNSKSVVFIWWDTKPPDILNISCKPDSWNLGKDIIVRVEVRDEDVISISHVNLTYTIDSGAPKEVSMFKIDKNIYETTISGQGKKCEITYIITAEDMAGNLNSTNPMQISVGEQENLLFFASLGILIVLIFIIMVKKTIDYRKVKKYIQKYQTKDDSK